ncbi:MAG: helix-turn-helix domain-containing protein [Pseudomonadota bacterium]
MPDRYQDIYPEPPLLESTRLVRTSASDLLTLEYFEAQPGTMPERVYAQHHILLNYRAEPHRVENWRDGEHRDFTYHKDEIVVTPAGMRSGWRWHATSKVIVVTLEPDKLERFAQSELGLLLTTRQLQDLPQFTDADICQAGWLLKDALETRDVGSELMFESLARVFLIKLLQKYGDRDELPELAKGFTSRHYKRVLDYVSENFGRSVTLDTLAREAGLSPSHFSRLFKQTIGQSPMQFVISYRVEQAKKMLADPDRALIDVALSCGFADQAHFSRVFKQSAGSTPKAWRTAQGLV